MNKTWTVRVLVAIVVAGVLDIFSTYIVTPDLSREANPIVILFNRTWTSFVMIKILLSLVAIAACPVGLRILQSRIDRLAGQSGFRNILSQLIFKRHVSLGAFLLYGWPKDWIALLAVCCLAVAVTTITSGVTAAALNLLNTIRSPIYLIVYWCGNGVFGASIAIWLTYRFIVEHMKAEHQFQQGRAAPSC